MATPKNSKSPKLYTKKADPETGVTSTMNKSQCFSVFQCVVETLHWIVSLGLLLLMDVFSKKAFEVASVELSGALVVMLCIFVIMMILYYAAPSAAEALVNFFEPGVLFIHRWLPLFYAPYLVMLPLSIKDICPSSDITTYAIIVGGCLATLYVTGYTSILTRQAMETEVEDDLPMENHSPFSAKPMKKPPTFSFIEMLPRIGVLFISFIASLFDPTTLGTRAKTCLPFLLASSVLGYMLGCRLPSNLKKVFHPVILCAASATLTAYAFGYFDKSGLYPVLGYYLTKSSSDPGAGDILLGFLGSFLISLPFSMCKRKLVEGHGPEILTSMIIGPIFLMFSTSLVRLLVILEPSLYVSILPKCITVALALCIVSLFKGGNSHLATAVFVVNGLIGTNYVQSSFPDPFVQGIVTVSSAGMLGTVALSAMEPKAFPFVIWGIF